MIDPQSNPVSASQTAEQRSPWKWLTFSIASVLLLTLVGLVIYAEVLSQNRPPILTVEIMEPFRAVEDQFYVPFIVANEGGESAEAIQIVSELRLNGETNESGEQQIGSLSGGEQIQGSFVFSHDPNQGDLILRVASYRQPQIQAKVNPSEKSQKNSSLVSPISPTSRTAQSPPTSRPNSPLSPDRSEVN